MNNDLHEYLNSYKELVLEIDRLTERGLSLRERAESTTSQITGMPRGSAHDNHGVLDALAAMEEQENRKLQEAIRKKMELESFVDRVDGDMERSLLRLRHIELLRWPDIQDKMASVGLAYELRHIYRLYKKAIRAAELLWEEERNVTRND